MVLSFYRHAAALDQDGLVYMLVSSCWWRIFAPSFASGIRQEFEDGIWLKRCVWHLPLESLSEKRVC